MLGRGSNIAIKLAAALCLIALGCILLYWLLQTIMYAYVIAFIWEVFVPMGLNPWPMIEWFYNIGYGTATGVETGVATGFPLVGYYGPTAAIDGLPIAFPVTSHFGFSPDYFDSSKYHTGIDMATRGQEGFPVTNVMAGQVTFAGYAQGYGYVVVVENQGVQSMYGHLSEIAWGRPARGQPARCRPARRRPARDRPVRG